MRKFAVCCGLVGLGLAGSVLGQSAATARRAVTSRSASHPTEDRIARHLRRLQQRLPDGFVIVRQSPFFVVGDEPEAVVRQRAEQTVKFAVDRLRRDFFAKDPDEIIDIWLFKDKASYEKHVPQLFGEQPHTPFGYYSPKHKALIMNIATGGGTLVHEIVHPYVRANFPDCPPWFNEGLGSLYEQCEDRDGHLHGLTNWRLAGLQKAIRKGGLPTFETLTGMDTDTFYGEDQGTNYALARYLLYYLQDKGLLLKYYHAFVAAQKDDPTGYATLKKTLGEDDMTAFQKKWEAYVLKLRFE